jgi:ketosteroid isomerase-like protein
LESFLATGDPVWATMDEHVEIRDHDIPEQGAYRGHDGFLRWMEDWDAPWAEWSLEITEFIDAGDRVVAIVHLVATGRGSGVEVEREDGIVYELRDGKLVKIEYFNNRAQALEAAGLSE